MHQKNSIFHGYIVSGMHTRRCAFGMFRLFSCDPSTSRLPEKIAVIRTLASVKPVDGYRDESPLDTKTSAEIAWVSSSRTVDVYFHPGLPLQIKVKGTLIRLDPGNPSNTRVFPIRSRGFQQCTDSGG